MTIAPRTLRVIFAVVGVIGLVTCGVAPPAGERRAATGPLSTTTTTGTTPTTTRVAVATPPPLTWTPCHASHQCSQLDVPLDYATPRGPHIAIALEQRQATTASRLGSLVLNPGGPGESGLGNFSKDLALLPAGVLARFDVIAFDPRGVGASSPVHCDPAPDSSALDPTPTTPNAVQALLAADRAYAAACLRASGQLLLDHVGTVDVARDLEALRLAVGDAGLSYLGLSYGTLLGATYAGMFPTHVRAMVLDGAIDPSLSTADLAEAQAHGFQSALDAFFAWCATRGCAWRSGPDPHATFESLATSVRQHPLAVGNRSVGPQQFFTGAFGTLYARGFWPSLDRALAAMAAGNGAPMLGLYDSYEHAGDPSFSGDANTAITCLDHPVPRDPSVYPERADKASARAPDFGPLFAWGALACAVWPNHDAAARPVGPIRAAGSPPILVVGTTEDPATPYAWARSLAAQLAGGVLLTRVGQDHVAIFTSSCVRSYDEVYLVTGSPPPQGTVCPA
ncbi:MAG: alpha/beta hydrolase [Acidimicrobiales bacterium]